jgi:hypothetical protein
MNRTPSITLHKPVLCQAWLRNKIVAVALIFAFFFFTSACSHSPAKSSPRNPQTEISPGMEIRSGKAYPRDTPWWEKPEYEWLIGTLIFVGIGIAVGGALMVSSGTGGLRINVSK